MGRSVASDLAETRRLLAELYVGEGPDIWLNSPHRSFGGERAIDLIERGDGERVLAELHRLLDGAFS